MQAINVLTDSTHSIDISELVFLCKQSNDYILSIPHSGVLVPASVERCLNTEMPMLVRTDLFTDMIYDTGKGNKIVSRLNPYVVNVNRYREGGNTSLPKHLQRDPLHDVSLTGEKVLLCEYPVKEKEKLMGFYDKYHKFIQEEIGRMIQEVGYALLFDCHSMSSIGLKNTPDEGRERPDFCIGTLDDSSAHDDIISVFYDTLKRSTTMDVGMNEPYKGGAITQKYNNPTVDVIQLEINKSTYMNEDTFEPYPDKIKKLNSIISSVFEATSKKARDVLS